MEWGETRRSSVSKNHIDNWLQLHCEWRWWWHESWTWWNWEICGQQTLQKDKVTLWSWNQKKRHRDRPYLVWYLSREVRVCLRQSRALPLLADRGQLVRALLHHVIINCENGRGLELYWCERAWENYLFSLLKILCRYGNPEMIAQKIVLAGIEPAIFALGGRHVSTTPKDFQASVANLW